jgi:hypothetical protein
VREGVVSIGEAGLAAAAIAEDLIDEYRQFVNPLLDLITDLSENAPGGYRKTALLEADPTRAATN